jgi:hypothetical protein
LPGVRPPVPTTILPSQDPSGQVPDLALSVLLVAGYLAATFAMQRTKNGGSPPPCRVHSGQLHTAGLPCPDFRNAHPHAGAARVAGNYRRRPVTLDPSA